jgi:hypothetical protein
MNNLIPVEIVTQRIFEIRGQKVMIDTDLASLYEFPTKRLNEAVKRNILRFPDDFMFQLTLQEKNELVAICDRFTKLKHSTTLPHAFTETGVAMLSSILNSETAIQINLQIMRAFIRLRQMLTDHEALRHAIAGLERKVNKNDREIQIAMQAIQSLLKPKETIKQNRKMGFTSPNTPVG